MSDLCTPHSAPSDAGSVKSASRVMLVLEYLAQAGRAPFSSIVRELRLPNSSAHQLLATMTVGGFVDYDETARLYQLGPRLWAVAQSYTGTDGIAATALPFMHRLVDEVRETAQLSSLQGRQNVYLAVVDSPHPMRLESSVGRRLPAHATGLGKVLLAALNDAEIARRVGNVELERYTENTHTDLASLMRDFQTIRSRGYGEDNEEFAIGCKCLARPIRDPRGQTVAALSVTVPTPRLTAAMVDQIHRVLIRTVASVERRLT